MRPYTLTNTRKHSTKTAYHSLCQMLATTIQHSNTTPRHHAEHNTTTGVASKPNSVPAVTACCPTPRPDATTRRTHTPPTRDAFTVLPRKEVIQPHLPVRLPCYDFVPIADPTFDASLPKRG